MRSTPLTLRNLHIVDGRVRANILSSLHKLVALRLPIVYLIILNCVLLLTPGMRNGLNVPTGSLRFRSNENVESQHFHFLLQHANLTYFIISCDEKSNALHGNVIVSKIN